MSKNFKEILDDYFFQSHVEEMEFERIDDKLCKITAHLKEGNQFTYTDEINWGSNITEFYDALDSFTNGVSYSFVNFDPEEEINRAGEIISNFYGDY